MEPETLIRSLSPIERKVVPHLVDKKSVSALAKEAGVPEVEAMRAARYLSNKEVLTLRKQERSEWELTERGQDALEHGLPEERFLSTLDKPRTLQEIKKLAKLDDQELNAAIGALRKAGSIEMGKTVSRKSETIDSFAERWKARTGLEGYEKRGLVERSTTTSYAITLTALGKKLAKTDLGKAPEERVTSGMLADGTWKGKTFRVYDVTTGVPERDFGRAHFVQEAITAIKRLWIEMGFSEMEGSMTQTAFWDMDSLFVPQDHPAREMQDTFYLPSRGQLPDWWEHVKRVHEDGADTGSTGWQTTYSEEEAKKVLLRTHTTVLSAQMLRSMRERGERTGKYFSVSKVFRNETLDWKHLFEFHQVEGIVVGEGLSIADLIGLQKEFYKKMGFTEVRFRPAYFPYTEPSAEVEVYHPVKKQWVELGGMGVFRPEVVKTLLGEDIPVLAWGLGMERIITDYYSITDLRELYGNDLAQLRGMKTYVPPEED